MILEQFDFLAPPLADAMLNGYYATGSRGLSSE